MRTLLLLCCVFSMCACQAGYFLAVLSVIALNGKFLRVNVCTRQHGTSTKVTYEGVSYFMQGISCGWFGWRRCYRYSSQKHDLDLMIFFQNGQ